MTERQQTDTRSPASGSPLQLSRDLIIALVVAVAATGALVISLLSGMPQRGGPGPNGQPPPPPDERPLVVFIVVTGFFVLAWLAALVILVRDQVLAHQLQADPSGGEVAALRADIAAELRTLGDRMTELTGEYGERRETDGYLNGMRTAALAQPPEANVRPIRRNPPPIR